MGCMRRTQTQGQGPGHSIRVALTQNLLGALPSGVMVARCLQHIRSVGRRCLKGFVNSMKTAMRAGWPGSDLGATEHALLLQRRNARGEPSAPATRHRNVNTTMTAVEGFWIIVM